MQKKIAYLPLILTSLMILTSCGGTSNNSKSDRNKDNISIPKNIFLQTPKLLEKSSTHNNNKTIDFIYTEIKDRFYNVEQTEKNLLVDMILLSQLTKEIIDRCEDTSLNSTCTIDKNELSITYSENIIKEIVEAVGDEFAQNIKKMKDKTIPLGKVEFTHYDEKQKYQYLLKVEYQPNGNVSYLNSKKESIKWSIDKKMVLSTISIDFSNDTSKGQVNSSFDFIGKENRTQKIDIYEDGFYSNSENDMNSTFISNFNIDEKGDSNKTFDVTYSNDSNYSSKDVNNSNKINAIGYISDNGGTFLATKIDSFNSLTISTPSDNKVKFDSEATMIVDSSKELEKGRDTFDNNGKIISSIYCQENSECDLNDESTWSTFDGMELYPNSESPVEPKEPK